jgi:hypothetical protein
MLLTTITFFATLAVSSHAAPLAALVDCSEYFDPYRDDGIHWSEEQQVLSHDISSSTSTDEIYDKVMQGIVNVKSDNKILFHHKHFQYDYKMTATLKSSGGLGFLTSELLSAKGAGQQWKLNVKNKAGKILHAYWLNTNAQCRYRSDWNLNNIGQVTVQYRGP